MTLPSLDTIIAYSTICFSIIGALLAAVWISLVVWTFRDMRARSRDPFAQLLAAVVVAVLPGAGLLVYLILRPPETLAEAYERALEEEALLQEIEERPACPGCSRTVDSRWILCPHCHTRLRKVCPDCNSLMELQWNLCPYCGNQHVDLYQASPAFVGEESFAPEPVSLREVTVSHGQIHDHDDELDEDISSAVTQPVITAEKEPEPEESSD